MNKHGRIIILLPLCLVLGWLLAKHIANLAPPVPKVSSSMYQVSGIQAQTIPDTSYQIPDTQKLDPIHLLFVGDIMLDRNVAKRMRASKELSYPFQKLPTSWFESFDYVVANLEGPVTDKRRPPVKEIDFQFDPSVISVLKEQGIDALSQANNHALDQGDFGYADSVQRLRDAGFLVFGHQVEDDEVALATTTIRGVRFAFLGYNTTDNPLDRSAARTVIENIRPQVDQIIVYMHWGQEYRNRPEPATRELAHWLIDQGVDVVIGGHPHWVQGMETYKEKPIVYSLGNFIFDQYFSKETQEGLAVGLVFSDGRVTVQPIPVRLDESQPRLVEGEELAARLEALEENSFVNGE